jgi:hypothetical protein
MAAIIMTENMTSVSDPYSFDPDPAFWLNTDPDPIRIRGFDDQKLPYLIRIRILDPDSESKSGSTDLIESGSNQDLDPEH